MAKLITTVTWSASGLPDGLTINPNTGVISGTPTCQPGTYTATITVTTNYGSDSKTITIIVEIPEDWKPVITPGQSITIIADTAMTPYTVQGTNVTKNV